MDKRLRFRHVFGDLANEKYECVKPASMYTESCLIKGNSKFLGFAWAATGGGNLAILRNDGATKLGPEIPMIMGHTGPVLDLEFSPFCENLLATASEDTTIKIWDLPEIMKEDMIEPLATLQGHQKKVNLIAFNPSAEYILASAANDGTIKIWNVQKPDEAVFTFEAPDNCVSIDWNHDGSLLLTTWKDKKIRIIDPRKKEIISELNGHEGSKSMKGVWMGSTGYFATTGFSKDMKRQIGLWKNDALDKPEKMISLDQQSGVLYPFYDSDLDCLYVAGKGDGNIKYFEYLEGELHYTSDFRTTVPGRGYGFYPKRCVDVARNEVMRAIKLTDTNVEFISFIAPRKSDMFQDDLYPECFGEEASLRPEEWIEGRTELPKRRTMKPGTFEGATKKTSTAIKIVSPKDQEIANLMSQIDTLMQEKCALVQKCDELELENDILNQELNHMRENFEHLKQEKSE